MAENGIVPGNEKGFARLKAILKGRKSLKKDMKAKGIYKRKDFNKLAESLDLALWKVNPFFTWLHYALAGALASMGLKGALVAGAALLTGGFLLSTITEEKGSFTINMSGEMLRAGFTLSESADFENPSSRLFSERLENINNITLSNIAPDVDEVDGPHNGKHYVAYTFYIKNDGEKDSNYAWYFKLTAEMKEASEAVWIMIFEDGRQIIYTRPTEDGSPEKLYGFSAPLQFSDVAYAPESQYYEEYDPATGRTHYGVVTTPYAEGDTVAQGLVENVPPGETHKYTVVLWVEGHDPECTNDLLGGYTKFRMEFEYIESADDKSDIFAGIYRTEYDNYGIETDAESGAESGDESDTETETDAP